MAANRESTVVFYDVFAAELGGGEGEGRGFFQQVENKQSRAQALAGITGADWVERLKLLPAGVDSERPAWLRLIEVEFTLIRNLTTRDGPSYYPHDNPIHRDLVFKCPVMPGSSWKGAIKAAAREKFAGAVDERRMLFGPEKQKPDEDDELNQHEARLHCLPTFFRTISRDILNPRNRRTRAGSTPINLEVISATTTATLQAIWSPFDLLGGPASEIERAWENDWAIMRASVEHMFYERGAGAKKSLSFGLAEDLKWQVNGIIQTAS